MPKKNHIVGPKMLKLLVEQYNREMFSALVYLQLAAVVERDNYLGFSQFFQGRAYEEWDHAHKFSKFISDAGGLAQLKAMPEPKVPKESLLDLFKQALDHEQMISDKIFKLKELAIKSKEYPTENFLIWAIREQLEEEASLDTIITNLERVKGDEAAVLAIQEGLTNYLGYGKVSSFRSK